MQADLGFLEVISFQNFVGNLDKIIVTNLGRHDQRSLDSYFKSFENICIIRVILKRGNNVLEGP